MTKLQIVGLIIVAGALGVLCAPRAGAVTVAPLSYAVELANGQQKKGFIDITNTEPTKTKYLFNVQAFRQLNSAGDLQFYENATIAQGILLDYATYELQPNQTLRLYFVADGTKLPAGDSFAAIFAEPAPRAGVASAAVARVGTILTIQNGTPTERKAQITKLAVPFVQIGSAITGNYSIKNTSDPTKSAGFVPQVELTVSPFRQLVRNKSSLVFRMEVNDKSVWFSGDSDVSVERLLLRGRLIAQTTFLKVSHHGSVSATCDDLLATLSPVEAIISVGRNSYGHPSQQLIDKLRESHIIVRRTDLDDSIVYQLSRN